jgi:hypothetical protein
VRSSVDTKHIAAFRLSVPHLRWKLFSKFPWPNSMPVSVTPLVLKPLKGSRSLRLRLRRIAIRKATGVSSLGNVAGFPKITDLSHPFKHYSKCLFSTIEKEFLRSMCVRRASALWRSKDDGKFSTGAREAFDIEFEFHSRTRWHDFSINTFRMLRGQGLKQLRKCSAS